MKTRRLIATSAAGLFICSGIAVAACASTAAPAGRPAAPAVAASARPTVRHSSPGTAVTTPEIRLRPDPVNTQLTGSQAISWAKAALTALGAPLTTADVTTMTTWFRNEGVPHDYDNPLNLCTPYNGSVTSTADGDPPSDHIQAYRTPQDFVHAFTMEMRTGYNGHAYSYIVADLESGRGMIGDHSAGLRNDLMEYSGGGYDSIPAAYL